MAASFVPSRRLLAAVAGASLLLACRANVLHDLPEADANKIVSVLQDHGIQAEKAVADEELNTWAI